MMSVDGEDMDNDTFCRLLDGISEISHSQPYSARNNEFGGTTFTDILSNDSVLHRGAEFRTTKNKKIPSPQRTNPNRGYSKGQIIKIKETYEDFEVSDSFQAPPPEKEKEQRDSKKSSRASLKKAEVTQLVTQESNKVQTFQPILETLSSTGD